MPKQFLTIVTRWALTLALIGLAWRAGEIGPWTALILLLFSIANEQACALIIVANVRLTALEIIAQIRKELVNPRSARDEAAAKTKEPIRSADVLWHRAARAVLSDEDKQGRAGNG